MNKPDPRLEKLVTGAQKYAPGRGYESTRHAKSAQALGNYYRWKESLQETPEDEAPAPAQKTKRKVKVVRDESGAITGFEAE